MVEENSPSSDSSETALAAAWAIFCKVSPTSSGLAPSKLPIDVYFLTVYWKGSSKLPNMALNTEIRTITPMNNITSPRISFIHSAEQ